MTIDRAGLVDYVEHFRARVLQDALAEATAGYWLRRAEALEDAMPRPGDFDGFSTHWQLEERRRRLTEQALACRRAATLAPYADVDVEVRTALEEAAA